jgi:hypothetical protein
MMDQTLYIVWMEDHPMILFWNDARQNPSLLGAAFQKRRQVRFGFDGHVRENHVALLEDVPVCDPLANCEAGPGAAILAESFSDCAASLPE